MFFLEMLVQQVILMIQISDQKTVGLAQQVLLKMMVLENASQKLLLAHKDIQMRVKHQMITVELVQANSRMMVQENVSPSMHFVQLILKMMELEQINVFL